MTQFVNPSLRHFPAPVLLRSCERFRPPASSMSNERRLSMLGKTTVRVSAALTVCGVALASPAAAQSAETLEAVRLHRADARAKAADELEHCKANNCTSLRPLSLLVGVLALSEGDAEAAVKQLAAYPAPKGLEAHAAFYAGEAAFYTRDYMAAAKLFDTALKAGPRSLELRAGARAGEAWLAARQPAKALPFLERAADEQPTPELLFERATARAATGHPDDARADFRAVALKFPAHPYAAEAAAHLPQARNVPLFTFEERLTRARGFLDARQASDAIAELDAAEAARLARGASAQAREALLRAEGLFARGEEEAGQKQLDIALKGQRHIAAEAALMRARRYLRATDNEKARAEMASVDKRFPKEPAGEEGGYLAGWLDLQGGRFADSVKAFEQYEKRHPLSHRRDEAAWFKSLAMIRLEHYPDARKSLDALVAQLPHSPLVPQARYWAARCLQLGGAKPEEVTPKLQDVIHAFPGSFYAVLAATRLKELSVDPPVSFPDRPVEVKAKLPSSLALAVSLAEAGLFRDASDEVLDRISVVHTQDDAYQFGGWLQGMGEYGAAYVIAARLLWGQAYGQHKPTALGLMYPRAYRDAVEAEAKTRDISPFFVWSIMRRESAFRPEVISTADARGLLQLLPQTASAIAKELKEPDPPADALYAPQLNIHLATSHLSELFKRFTHPVLVAAAYNANPDQVRRWIGNNGTMPLDLFVEMIPYKETRGYVKQVVADYHVYSALYGAPETQPQLALTVPAPAPQTANF
jgi:soluble lytic murein transglycosylase